VPANTLATNGDMIHFTASILTVAGAANQSMWVSISGVDLWDLGGTLNWGGTWIYLSCWFQRSGPTSGQFTGSSTLSQAITAENAQGANISSVDWTGTETLEIDAQNGVATTNGVQIRAIRAIYYPAA